MPAVPAVVTISITVSTELSPLKVTGTVAIPSPSFTITLPIVTVGAPSLSVMVPVAVAVIAPTGPVDVVMLTVRVSVGSAIVSSVVGTLAVAVVAPAKKVTTTGVVV